MDPPSHPKLGDLLRLVHESHVKQELRGTTDAGLESRPDPLRRVSTYTINAAIL